MKKLILYNHGKDSEPWGSKPLALAEVAKNYDYEVKSPDYRGQLDPDQRVKELMSQNWSDYEEIVLVGSSMGGYVATLAAADLKPSGLFLLSPAFYLPGYRQTKFNPPADKTMVIHGWRDEIVPPENAWKFCRQYHIQLNMLDTDHRLLSKIPEVIYIFDRFIKEIMK